MYGISYFNLFLRLNKSAWDRVPPGLRDTRAIRSYGTLINWLVRRRADRKQFTGTFFFRNRAELELLQRLAAAQPEQATIKVAVLGCSVGAEIYSLLWMLRSARPDLDLRFAAVDKSAEVLKVAKEAVYSERVAELVGASIWERITQEEFGKMFDVTSRGATVMPWLREGISWHLADAADATLLDRLGPQDIVFASNFLCHMNPADAERCLRNIGRLVKPGGHLFVSGIDLNVRTRVARDLHWRPVPELLEEIHEGDPSLRRDWPFSWWGLEPLNRGRCDWTLRYATAFQIEMA